MIKQLLPRITPAMLKHNPDQVSMILNRLIDNVNHYNNIDLDKLAKEVREKKTEPTPPGPGPTPSGEWGQVLQFDPTKMGTTPGMCLQNCRLGFGLATGQFPSARADKESQIANGTLHPGVPPLDVQVAVYVDFYEEPDPNGHVVVWDRGTVWQDGYIVQGGLSIYTHLYGWGELCDGRRTVIKLED